MLVGFFTSVTPLFFGRNMDLLVFIPGSKDKGKYCGVAHAKIFS